MEEPIRVTRERSVSRLDKQLWVKAYDILVPLVQAHRLLPQPANGKCRHRLTARPLHTKGV
jgi:hypothetical protein